jgi:ppGpp synthetase/RelA/SpoT-type nucleotidyltranferase
MAYGVLEEIRKYISEKSCLYEREFIELTKSFSDARDNYGVSVPIYFSKWRIKKAESAYLKIKRKGRPYKTLTDYGGMRLLCLFEGDMIKIHDYLLWLFKELEYELYECIIYNFDRRGDMYYSLKKSEEEHFPGHFLSSDSKKSGYKSIHYLVHTKDDLYIEIQLRTLVQDVWCELEHALSYKNGSAHPHIKKSFSLLAKELENVDDMLSYLQDLDQKELATKIYSNEDERPIFYVEYESDLLPKCFSDDGELSKAHDEYRCIIEGAFNSKNTYQEVRDKYYEICGLIKKKKFFSELLDYWMSMEHAYICYGELMYEDAIGVYKELIVKHPDRYCIYYRLGQIYLNQGRVADALDCFDKVGEILDTDKDKHILNQYRIRTLLAYVYWQLGDGYIDLSMEEIEKAEVIYNENKNILKPKHYFILINNIAWYSLERYIISSRDKGDAKSRVAADRFYAHVVRRIKILEQNMENNEYAYLAYDTLAWYYYQKYRRTKCLVSLGVAKDFTLKMGAKVMEMKDINILNMQTRHIQEIVRESEEMSRLLKQKEVYKR